MKNIILRTLFILIALNLFSCANSISKILPERPGTEFQKDLEKASPEFRQGWTDGCEVGMSAGSNTFYKMFYKNNAVDGYKMAYSSEYKTGLSNAFWYCYRKDYIKLKSSIWSSTFSGYR
jgi:hypothetical protein